MNNSKPLEKWLPVPSTSNLVAMTARIDNISTAKCLFLETMALMGIMPKIMIPEAIRMAATIHPNWVLRSMIATAAKTESRLKRMFMEARYPTTVAILIQPAADFVLV